MTQQLKNEAEALLVFAKGTRDDFHEPDEQGIKLRAIVGTELDNAYGNVIMLSAIREGWQEAIVIVERNGQTWHFNLANLFALAKLGAQSVA